MNKLIILDLDETLIHSCSEWIGRPYSFIAGDKMIHERPGAKYFIESTSKIYKLAVWSASHGRYAQGIISELFGSHCSPEFVWTRERCGVRTSSDGMAEFTKDLSEIAGDYRDFMIIDDRPDCILSGEGRVLSVPPYYGASSDTVLSDLLNYLCDITDSDWSELDFKNWSTT